MKLLRIIITYKIFLNMKQFMIIIVCIYVCIYDYNVCVYIYIYIYIYIYTHTHIHTCVSLLFMTEYELSIATPLYNENFNQCY